MKEIERKIVEFINSLPVEDIFTLNRQILNKLTRNSKDTSVLLDAYFEVKKLPFPVEDCHYYILDEESGFEYSLEKYSNTFYFGSRTSIL